MPLEQFLYRWPHEHDQREDPENDTGEAEEIQNADEEAESVTALLPKLAACQYHHYSVNRAQDDRHDTEYDENLARSFGSDITGDLHGPDGSEHDIE